MLSIDRYHRCTCPRAFAPRWRRAKHEADTVETSRTPSALIAVVMALGCGFVDAGGQVGVIDDKRQCARCEIVLTRVATLGDTSDTGLVSDNYNYTIRRPSGGWLVVANPNYHEVAFFNSGGRPVRRFGRMGKGPGEFTGIIRILPVGNDVALVDPMNLRITVVDKDFNVVDEVRLPARPREIAALPDSTWLINAEIFTPARVGKPLHVLDRGGGITVSFGDRGEPAEPPFDAVYRMAQARDGTIWTVRTTDYRIEQWDRQGRLLRSWSRPAEWLKDDGSAGPVSQGPGKPTPSPRVVRDIRFDADGLLWVLGTLPDPEWRNALEEVRLSAGVGYIIRDPDRYYDHILEVVDVQDGSIVKSQRFDRFMSGFTAPREAASWSVDGHGIPHVQVWRLDLRRR